MRSTVVFRPLTADAIDGYIATGEPFDKAGAYGIQGGAAAFVERVSGSYTNIVGLPMEATIELLGLAGIFPGTASTFASKASPGMSVPLTTSLTRLLFFLAWDNVSST